MEQYPEKIKWHKLMERKNLFFVGLAFADVESAKFNGEMDFELKNFLFRFERGNWATYKSDEEFKKLYAHIGSLIIAGDTRFVGLAQKGNDYNAQAREYTTNHISHPTPATVENFDREYELYKNILLYGVTIPWDVIGAIEAMPKDQHGSYKGLLGVFEPLRAVSLYPDFEREVLQKYRKALADKYNISIELLSVLTPLELGNHTKGQTSPVTDTLKKRYEYCVSWYNPENCQIEFSFDRSIEERIPALKEIEIAETKEIKGNIAFKGVVQGRVRILYDASECPAFKEGEILVSPSTNPTLMPAILKCAGIVTDEGGMTSHAAIIARELKKPAVIGTKIATRVLKDGDLVEVDAELGTVKILG